MTSMLRTPDLRTASEMGGGQPPTRTASELECAALMSEISILRSEIDRLSRLIKVAADAYNSGDEDECCIACMTIAEELESDTRT